MNITLEAFSPYVKDNTTTIRILPPQNTRKTMKALVYGGAGIIELKDAPLPQIIKPTDAVVRVLKTTICGTDLGIIHGKTPSVLPGTTLGHEGVGLVEEIGSAITKFKKGDRVIISCITADGTCEYCKKQMFSHCENGGWILGHTINGTQAEYVRIPHADNSLYAVPEGLDEESLVMLSDILPTGYEIGVLYGCVKPGDTIAIVGAGPVGMAALLTAQVYSPAEIYIVDVDQNCLDLAKQWDATYTINSGKEDAIARIMLETKDGVDVSIEAVGIPDTSQTLEFMAKNVDLQIQKRWISNITITTGVVNTSTIPLLLKTITDGQLQPSKLITHHFRLVDILEAYKVLGNASVEKAMKVIIFP